MAFEWLKHFVRLPSQQVAAFCKDRTRQTDEQFVADCGLPNDAEAVRIAIAVRRAVADVGAVDPEFIRADDDYPGSLEALPLWDSMSWYEFEFALEMQLGTRFEDPGAVSLPNDEKFTVRQMAAAVIQYVSRNGPTTKAGADLSNNT